MYPLNFLMKNLYIEFRNPHFQYKIVRWKRYLRKPFWLPIAKTKMFVPPKVVEKDPVEEAELERLNTLYDVHLHSLRAFMQKDEGISTSAASYKFEEPEKNIEKSLTKNDEFNQRSKELREARLKRSKQEEEDEAIRIIEERENLKKERRVKIARIAQIELEKSKTFIKQDNVDKILEECLKKTVTYNYAIDVKGNVYKNNEIVDKLSKEEKDKRVEEVSQ